MNELTMASLSMRVWGTIATTIAGRKDKSDYRKQVAEWCAFLEVEVGTEVAAAKIVEATPLFARLYRERIARGRALPTREGDPDRDHIPAPSTLRKKLYILRAIYRDMLEEGLIERNPFLLKEMPGLDYVKRPTLCVPFSKVWAVINMPGSDEYMKFLETRPRKLAPVQMSEDKAMRDRAWLSIIFGGALRKSEIIKLRVRDLVLDEDDGSTQLFLRGTKNGTDAKQTIPPWAAELVWKWQNRRVRSGAQPNDFLFCPLWKDTGKSRGGGMTGNAIYKAMKLYLECAGLDPRKFSPHSARVTSITKAIKDGALPSDVMGFSRHKSLDMVEHYNKPDEAKGKETALRLAFAGSAKSA